MAQSSSAKDEALSRKHDDAEARGRRIGIFLHWLFVKPLQLLWLGFLALFWVFKNLTEILVSTVIVYAIGIIFLLIWLTAKAKGWL